MDFELTKEHSMIQGSVADFIKKEHPLDDLKEMRKDPLGYSKKTWRKMAELGWLELLLPEKYGGFGYDLSFAMVLLEEFGKGLLPSPWISTVLLGGNLILTAGTETQKETLLPAVASGDLWMAAAYLEDQGHYDVNYCSTRATREGNGYSLSGEKIFVMDGMAADSFIVSARTSGA
ncbi:MAG: pimeloyl-CoA dehydrogenase small subunit, partial [Proteobacteria bacterium]|nr:pimeloyl-CoA dehydrogenase small subunit [Pseudomonadota bacterium]